MAFSSETARLAGQKSKRGISQRTRILDELFDKEKARAVFAVLEQKALGGDNDAIKTYLAYCFGKPEAKIDVTTYGESLKAADLDKLTAEQLKNLLDIKCAIEN